MESFEISGKARAALGVVWEPIYWVCFIYKLDFHNLIEEHEVDYRESMVKPVAQVLADPSQKIG